MDASEDPEVRSLRLCRESLQLVLDDFSTKLAAFEKQGTRFLFDWESWVGYSEWSWRSFLRNQPGRPFVVRVILSKCAYYNYQFAIKNWWFLATTRRGPGGLARSYPLSAVRLLSACSEPKALGSPGIYSPCSFPGS